MSSWLMVLSLRWRAVALRKLSLSYPRYWTWLRLTFFLFNASFAHHQYYEWRMNTIGYRTSITLNWKNLSFSWKINRGILFCCLFCSSGMCPIYHVFGFDTKLPSSLSLILLFSTNFFLFIPVYFIAAKASADG